MSRKLASIRRVSSLEPIDGADRIELAHIDGWQCVVRKGEFKEGDLGVYFEIDSRLPEGEPWAEFLRPKGFKVKTMKLRGTLSQGLLLPAYTCLPLGMVLGEGDDLTSVLKVTKILSKSDKESEGVSGDKTPWYFMLLPKFLRTKRKWGFPEFIPKTDETRVQNIRNLEKVLDGRMLYATEKLDGQSVTIWYHRKLWDRMFRKGIFGVCSRNVYYRRPTNNNWWNIAKENNLDEVLPSYCKKHKVSYAIQGEICGPGIQGDKYRLPRHTLFVYSVWDIENQRYLTLEERLPVLKELGLTSVPYLSRIDPMEHFSSIDSFLRYADRTSYIGSQPLAEGIVVRDIKDDSFSFKAINNRFLLKYDL